jgi:gliding motility-associated-like protein
MKWNNNTFIAYLLTEKGVIDSVKTSIGGVFKDFDYTFCISTNVPNRNNFGQMKISPAGDMVALTMFAEKAIEVFSFNNNTGQLGCFRRYDLSSAMGTDEYLYGIEISPNGRFVYVSSQKKIIEPYESSLYQIDLLEPNPQKAIQVIARGQSGYTGLQLAIDGKIYVARFYQQHLGVIHQPNLPYPACNFEEEGLYLNGNRVGIAINNIVSSFLPKSSPILELPNAFTPNGDGINDSFVPIRMEGVFVKDIRIYNSWGKEVHKANNFEQAWEGKNVPAGVYHYAITYHTGYLCEQNTQVHKGWVQVLK